MTVRSRLFALTIVTVAAAGCMVACGDDGSGGQFGSQDAGSGGASTGGSSAGGASSGGKPGSGGKPSTGGGTSSGGKGGTGGAGTGGAGTGGAGTGGTGTGGSGTGGAGTGGAGTGGAGIGGTGTGGAGTGGSGTGGTTDAGAGGSGTGGTGTGGVGTGGSGTGGATDAGAGGSGTGGAGTGGTGTGGTGTGGTGTGGTGTGGAGTGGTGTGGTGTGGTGTGGTGGTAGTGGVGGTGGTPVGWSSCATATSCGEDSSASGNWPVHSPPCTPAGADCIACEDINCPHDTAFQPYCQDFSAAADKSACQAVLDCVRETNCIATGNVSCFCGADLSVASCKSNPIGGGTGAHGACRDEIIAAFPNGATPANIVDNIGVVTIQGGAALSLAQCDFKYCGDITGGNECVPYCR